MLEARLSQGSVLKKLVDAIKDLVTEGNFEANNAGIALQAMDSSHICLVTLLLRADGFEQYRCDRPRTLGVSTKSLATVLKSAGNDDVISLRAQDDADTFSLVFESAKGDRISDFEIKLMDIDAEHMAIPETEYSVTARFPGAEFTRVCRDLSAIGDSITVSATKEGVKFTVTGDVGTGNVTFKHTQNIDKPEQAIVIDVSEPGVEYRIEDIGYVRYYLAPKIEDMDDDMGGGGGGGDGEDDL